jgi:uncharacterized DUF497 family protein
LDFLDRDLTLTIGSIHTKDAGALGFVVATIKAMEITYDPAKDVANIGKHGVSLALATELEWDSLWAEADNRRHYGEERFIGFALLVDRLYCVVFTNRGEQRRIISLRKANDREIISYGKVFDAA